MTNLSSTSKDTLNDLFGIPLLKAFGFLEGALDIRFGDWLYDLYGQVSGAVALAGDILLAKEVNHSITVEASTTTNANGANLTLQAGDANGSGTDGTLTLGGSHTEAVQLSASGKKLGFYGVTPAVRPTALTQTYSTASATLAANTSATLTDSSTGSASTTLAAMTGVDGTGSNAAPLTATKNAVASLAAQVNALQVDLLNAKQFTNQIVDQLQALGLLQ